MSGVKGYPSQKKLTTNLTPYNQLDTNTTMEFVTAQPTYSDKVAQDVQINGVYRISAVASTLLVGSLYPKRELKITSHGGKKGDIVRFEQTATNPGFEATIQYVPDVNTIILASELPIDSVPGDTCFILRHVTPRYGTDGTVVTSQGPIQFIQNAATEEVELDTATPANSRPLPVVLLDISGARYNGATETTLAAVEVDTTLIASNTTAIEADTTAILADTTAILADTAQIDTTTQSILAELQDQNEGDDYLNSVRLDYGVTTVTNSAWTELLSTVGATAVRSITLFDGGGFAMELGVGGAGSETRRLLIPPGGFNGKIKINIAAGTRLSIRAIGAASVTAGEIDINLFG